MNQENKDVTRYIVHTKGISQQMSRYIRMTSDLYHAALNYVINVCVSHWDEICGLNILDAKTYGQLPAAKAAGLYDSTGQCSLSKRRHTPYPDTARLAALPQKTEQRSARLEGGSLASCHARGSIRFILYRIKDSYEP